MLSKEECQQARVSRDPRFDGLFFILVKSTKIFCRNTCKVRLPLEKNVEYAQNAQQALHLGYRPCLRCRPDSAPNSSAWLGVNTTVNRAIKLLNTRLDKSIDEIADALGITSRYLHKLFQEHLQISPKRFRIYQQVLFAKRLLQQTSLSVESVAQAVGFENSRQLQQHIKTYLRLTPSQLRKEADIDESDTRATQLGSTYSENLRVTLSYRPPYNWPQVRDFYDKRQISENEKVTLDSIDKVFNIEDKDVAVSIKHASDKLAFYLSFSPEHANNTLTIIANVRRMLDLDANPQIIEAAIKSVGLSEDDIVTGLRIPGVANEFEAVCRAILGQQVSVSAAVNKLNDLYAHFAKKHNQARFPSPAQVANDDLLFLKIPALRRQSLIDTAIYFTNNDTQSSAPNNSDIQPEGIASSGTEYGHFVDGLIDIKGIGPWTINYVKMRALADTDVWLNTDLVIKKQVQKYQDAKQDIQANRAAPWRSYLTLNLWSIS